MRYPYEYTQDDFGRIDDWIDALWDFQKQVATLAGPIIEIAGPTTSGYYWLKDIELPSQLIITNVNSERSQFEKDDVRDRAITQVADVKQMPWQDQSVDMVLCSCLSIVEEHEYMEYLFSDKKLPDSLANRWSSQVAVANHTAEHIALGVGDLSNADPDMLRLSFIKEALRVLSSNGIIVVNGIGANEIKIMQRYGLTLRRLMGEYSIDSNAVPDSRLSYAAVLSY